MTISADTLLDRMHLKGQISRWRLFAIVLAVLAVYLLVGGSNSPVAIGRAHIARLTLDQIILDDRDTYKLISNLQADGNVRAVIVWLDTPGGSAVGGEEIYLRLRALSEEKPVVAVMRSVAASAGYMAALGANRIYAREGTITGSIGVIIEAAEVTGLAEKIGVKPIIVKSNALKSTLSPFEKPSPESIAVVQKLIDDFYNRFVDIVATGRKLPREQVVKLADGRVYSGREAVSLNLVDAIGGEEDALAWLQQQNESFKYLEVIDKKSKQPLSFMEQASQSLFGKFFQNSRIKLDGLVAIWHPELL